MRGVVVLAATLLGMGATAQAQVAVPDGYGIERFRLAMDGGGLIDVDTADVPGHLKWSVGLWTGLAHDPLVLYSTTTGSTGALVSRRVTTGVVGALGLGDRAELAVAFDAVDYQATTVAMTSLPTGGLGDLRLAGKVRLVRADWLDVAVVPAVTVPMGSARGYLRDPGATFAPEVVLGAHRGPIHGAVDLGYRARKRVDIAGLVIDDEVFGRAGAGLALDEKVNTEVAVSASVSTPTSHVTKNQVAAELLAGVAHRVTPEVGLLVAAGVGLDNGFGTPDWRAVLALRVAPAAPPPLAYVPEPVHEKPPPPDADADHDGIPDARDRCPTQPEDLNGFEDEDGCPDPTATLTGRVVDAEGRGIEHASLVITDDRHPRLAAVEASGNDDGAFTAQVHPSTLAIAASAPGYQPGTAQATVAAGATGTVAIKLARVVRQGQLRGQVMSFDGKPLAAKIRVSGKTTATTQTDADGTFTVDLPEGAFEVVIESPGYQTQHRNVSVKLDGVTVLNADMRGEK